VLTTCHICQAAWCLFDWFAEKLPDPQSPAIVHTGVEQKLDTPMCKLRLNTGIKYVSGILLFLDLT
jgi:hypothetical protein